MSVVLTVDGLITLAGEDVVLIRRAKPPFMDKLVMPGGHVEAEDVSMSVACARELEEEIGFKVDPGTLSLLCVLDHPEADPRPRRRVSLVYTLDLPDRDLYEQFVAATDARELVLRPLMEITSEEIGFDHFQAILALRRRFAGAS